MKVIVSHDVDHLYPSEHWTDLIFPKLWVRSFIELLKRQISLKTFGYRLLYIFDKRMNRIPEICDYDIAHGVKATYFFGMACALGMYYKKEKAVPWIQYVRDRGFDAGVHGCDYQNLNKIQEEHDAFRRLSGITEFGIRNHYVRCDDTTFEKMNSVGYLFDSTEFNKQHPEYKDPYKVGQMWEFPLAIMDGYVMHHDLEKAKQQVSSFVHDSIIAGDKYLTILFHDVFYNSKCYPCEKVFYEWLIEYLQEQGLEFVSYKDVIQELENGGEH